MKVLVTGGSGFIGSHIVNKLKKEGHDVCIYDMVTPRCGKDVEHYRGSLLDLEALRMAMFGIDVVYHLGAIADVKVVYEEPHYSESVNVRGTINVLEAARRSKRIKRVIYASTTWVYSDCKNDIVDETTPLPPPTHLYTATKLVSEYYCQNYSRLYGLNTTVLRYGIPYGPRIRGGAVLPIFVKKALSGDPITLAGDGSQFRNFVYVEDLAEGNVLALKDIEGYKMYNLSGDQQVTIKQIADTVQEVLNKKLKIEHIPLRPGDFAGIKVDNSLAKKELGWSPHTDFKSGVKKYVDWYLKTQQ